MKKIKISTLRKITQIAFLLLFLVLFRMMDHNGIDILFFHLDPLLTASVLLAAKSVVLPVLPALIIILMTVILGRFFCGWVCPMGTLIDGAGHIVSPKEKEIKTDLGYLKYIFLTIILFTSLFGLQLAGFMDPFSILVRGLAFSVDSGFNYVVAGFFDAIYKNVPWLAPVSEPVYSFFKSTILPYKQTFFFTSLLSFIILVAIFAMEFIQKRFWCRNLCPLGALFAVFSRFALLKRFPVKTCKSCGDCADTCKMNAVNTSGYVLKEECTLCMTCLDSCEKDTISFKFKANNKDDEKIPINLSRRSFIWASIGGLTLPFISKVNANAKINNASIIRPPGSLDEEKFLSSCVRCGQCMKACITNGLQPVVMEQGLEGFYTPKLVPEIGPCEYNCTLCGQVCPTGAIKKLPPEEKKKFVIGKASLNPTYCLEYRGVSCLVCEEHCPVPDKAIKHREMKINRKGKDIVMRRPFVDDALCIGCGVCENKCPVIEHKAIKVYARRVNPQV